MRLIIKFKAENTFSYDLKLYHKLQGFVYSLIKDTKFSYLHDLKDYKFISFSNIFPPTDAQTGDYKTLIISSPNVNLVKTMKTKLDSIRNNSINIGHMRYSLVKTSLLKPIINENLVLITGTPVIVRIPKNKFSKYEPYWEAKYDYLYWRSHFPLELFVDQIEQNIKKKFLSFFGYELPQENMLNEFIFKKQVCNHVILNGQELKMIGTHWKIIFNNLDNEQKKVVSFILDSGIGELNSMGFGFLNIIRSN